MRSQKPASISDRFADGSFASAMRAKATFDIGTVPPGIVCVSIPQSRAS